MKQKLFQILIAVVGLFAFLSVATAATTTVSTTTAARAPEGKTSGKVILKYPPPCFELPGVPSGQCEPPDVNITGYIKRLYQFAVGISGVLAVGMIVAGGIFIATSGGSPDRQSEGKNMIMSAIWGIVLILGSFLILKTINPVLVELRPPPGSELHLGTFALQKATCPNPSNTGCFFNDEGEACDFEDPGEVCNAVDKSTPECKPGANPPHPCACKDCQLLDDAEYPVKSTACTGSAITSSTLGKCFLEKDTLKAFKFFLANTSGKKVRVGTGPRQWRVTEAFPPTVRHLSPFHYNGKAFDFAINWNVNDATSLKEEDFCEQTKRIVEAASLFFKKILIEYPSNLCDELNDPKNLPPGVEKKMFDTTSGFHIHIENPK